MAIKHSLTGLVVRLYLIENIVIACTVDKRRIDVNDDITIHMSALETASIDVSTIETAIQVIGSKGRFLCNRGYGLAVRTDRIPNQLGLLHIFPAFGLDFQTREVYFQFVFVTVVIDFWTFNESTKEFGIIIGLGDIGFVTASHQFFVDNNLIIKRNGNLTLAKNTTHVTTTVERTNLSSIGFISSRVWGWCSMFIVESDIRFQGHATAFHVLFELVVVGFSRSIFQFNLTEFLSVNLTIHQFQQFWCHHISTIVAKEHFTDDYVGT